MGFYIRKSLSFGPLRFNLSKSGIGLSAGVKGLRIGSGPRGNYIHMGRNGLYFRQSLPSAGGSASERRISREPSSNVVFQEIESANTLRMTDAAASELLREINVKAGKSRIWPWVTIAALPVIGGTWWLGFAVWIQVLNALFFAAAIVGALKWDAARKTVVLYYEMEPQFEEAYQQLHDAFARLRSCAKLWHIESRGNVVASFDRKTQAGASSVVNRKEITASKGSPPYFHTNISIPILPAGRQRLFFMPDRILVWERGGVGTVRYDQLRIVSSESRFIETGSTPRDSRVVDTTWQYVNVSGGPDRRYSNNEQLPVVLYEEIHLTSASGLREAFQLSKTGVGAELSAAVEGMVVALNTPPPERTFEKCVCATCNGFIEFPAEGVGQTIQCPHCGSQTTLSSTAS